MIYMGIQRFISNCKQAHRAQIRLLPVGSSRRATARRERAEIGSDTGASSQMHSNDSVSPFSFVPGLVPGTHAPDASISASKARPLIGRPSAKVPKRPSSTIAGRGRRGSIFSKNLAGFRRRHRTLLALPFACSTCPGTPLRVRRRCLSLVQEGCGLR